jgi:hypothetical protein
LAFIVTVKAGVAKPLPTEKQAAELSTKFTWVVVPAEEVLHFLFSQVWEREPVYPFEFAPA